MYLIIRYFFDLVISVGKIKIRGIEESEINRWKHHLRYVQPMLQLFQANNDKEKIIHKAKYILNHDFILFGKKYSFLPNQSDTFGFYQKINWHYDPSTKNHFPRKDWYRLVRRKSLGEADIKYPWELSRFQHFILLGQAYADSNEEKYTVEFINQITDWIENNPVRYGINWSNTMEVGIRAENWTIALLYFIKSRHMTKEFLKQYFKSMQEHGNHIYRNLENLQPINSNHYIGNLFGLFTLSIICPFLKQSHKWLKFSREELDKEIIKQTDKDGWDYEASTAYHRLVTEMFLYTFIIADYFNQPFSNTYINQLKKMLKVMNIIQKPDYTIPQIGDNDSGFSLLFDFENDNLNLSNLSLLAQRNSLLTLEEQKSGFFIYEDAGYYIYRNDGIYLLLTTGPKELLGLGSHAHNDVLSYILNINGEDILIDPGTYVYVSDPSTRNHFRSISSHNILYWDKIEPRDLTEGIFKLVEHGKIEIQSTTENNDGFSFEGKYCYENNFHQRSIYCNHEKGYIAVTDTASREGAILNFSCGPDNLPHEIENGFTVNNVIFEFTDAKKISINDSFYSSGYGKIQPTKSVKVFLSGTEITYKIFYRS